MIDTKSNRNGRTGPDVTGSAQKNPRPRASTAPDDLLNALVERERLATERLFASLADEAADLDAMIARDQDQMDRVLAELGRQDREQVAMIDAMIAAEQAETDRALADLARADPAAEIAAMLDADDERIDRLLAELIDRDQNPATWTKGRRK